MAIGRKNYLFAGSDGGARHAAFLYSLLGTCKLHNVETFAYLCDVIARIGDHKHKEIHERLPQNWQPLTTWRSSKRWLAIGTRSSGTYSELIELTAF